MDARRLLGAAGEDVAAEWYLAHGYTVVARNWRCREGELDLVVRRGRELVFVEVKARRSTRFGLPYEAVTVSKQQRIRTLATRYLQVNGVRAGRLRFDVVSILAGEVQVLQAAF